MPLTTRPISIEQGATSMNNLKLSIFSIVKACVLGYLTIAIMEMACFRVFGVGAIGAIADGTFNRHFKPKVDKMIEGSKDIANKAMHNPDEPESTMNKGKKFIDDVASSDEAQMVKGKARDIANSEPVEKAKNKARDVANSEPVEKAKSKAQDAANSEPVEEAKSKAQDVSNSEPVEKAKSKAQDAANSEPVEKAKSKAQDAANSESGDKLKQDTEDFYDFGE